MSPHVLLAVAGVLLVVSTTLAGADGSPVVLLPFLLWAAAPYALLWVMGRTNRNPWLAGGAGAAALAVDVGIRAAVFVWPRGSTAGIALVFSPALIALVAMPAGAAAGWLAGTLWRRHAAGRLAVVVAAPIALGLTVLGFARPELFPTAVASRRAVLARVGLPRVVSGGERFESVTVAEKSAWFVVGELDGEAGEEAAVVDHDGAEIYDATTLERERRVDFTGRPGGVWGSFSTLVRLPGGVIAVADTGGGFSPTVVKDLSGAALWEYRPHPTLAPSALRPADLDGDGTTEFYGASADAVARIDAEGREVWRGPARMATLAALLPRDGTAPAWIVGREQGGKVTIWDADGEVLWERSAGPQGGPQTAVESFAGRALVHGGRVARASDLQGNPLFDVALGDFTLTQAIGVRLLAGQPPVVALVGATDRDTQRWRLLVVNADRQVVYDEVLDHPPRLLAAKRADGLDALLVAGDRRLRVLQPRAPGSDRGGGGVAVAGR